MKKIISGENIVKSFGTGDEKHKVLDGATACVNEGEFVAVMGPSGSGKSTLLYALCGIEGIDSGHIAFDGRALSAYGENELADLRRTQMGFIFQQPTMLRNLNLLDNILLPALRGRRKETAKLTERAKSLMRDMGIEALGQRDITQVSGGQLQRAGICRALLGEPKILFGDEPTGALNAGCAREVMELLEKINADGTAILLVTHDAKVAAVAQRILFLCDGKVVSELSLGKANGADERGRQEAVAAKMRALGI